MSALLLILIWTLPLMLIVFARSQSGRWLMILAPLPAVFAALTMPIGTTLSLPWLLLGVELGLDETGRVFLLFSSLLWLVASMTAAGESASQQGASRYRVFFLLTMAGNLGLIVAQDILSFYLGFTLMGLAAYGLIAQPASQRARHAARRYLVWTIAGEMVLFVALITLAYQHDGATTFRTLVSDSPGGLVVLLLIIGFGIKLALPGLHFWLPQAYAVSPTSAVMVLSGAMIKAGLLGWLRFLPGGDDALVNWGQALFIIGIIGMFYGAIMGLLQHRPRLLLGYSSISKMGTITTGMGAALLWPASASLMMAALVIYAAHHALIKGALFLSVGLIERGGLRLWLLVGLIVLSLAMAGAPLTSGALAKSMVSTAIPAQAEYFLSVLALAAFMTTLLMARFLFLIYSQSYPVTAINDVGAITAWLLLLDIIVVWPMLVATEDQLWAGILPLTIGIIVAWIALFYRWRLPGRTRMTKTYAIRRCFLLRSKKGIQDLLHALQTLSAKFMSGGAWAYPRRQWHAGQRLLQFLRVHDDIQLWHVTAGLWLGIAAVLMTIFILAR